MVKRKGDKTRKIREVSKTKDNIDRDNIIFDTYDLIVPKESPFYTTGLITLIAKSDYISHKYSSDYEQIIQGITESSIGGVEIDGAKIVQFYLACPENTPPIQYILDRNAGKVTANIKAIPTKDKKKSDINPTKPVKKKKSVSKKEKDISDVKMTGLFKKGKRKK